MFKIVQGLGFLFWLKVASFAITSVLGIIAVLHDFKEKDGKKEKSETHVNFWGKLTLAGLVVATLIGVAAQVEESREQKDKDDKNVNALNGLTEKNQTLLNNNEALLSNNKALLDNNQTLLVKVGSTLEGVQRNLQKVDDSMQVDYVLRIPLNDTFPSGTVIGNYPDRLSAKLKELHEKNQGRESSVFPITAKDTKVRIRNDNGTLIYDAEFGVNSDLMPDDGIKRLMLSKVPFQISFWKDRPLIDHGTFRLRPDKLAAEYQPPLDQLSLQKILRTTYNSAEHSVKQGTNSGVIFRLNRNPGGFVSVLDFRGMFMLVETDDDRPGIFPPDRGLFPVRFCFLSIQLGTTVSIRIPLQDATADKAGSILYQLPKSFDRLNALTKKTYGQACPDFPEVRIPVETFVDDPDQN
jgi:hypothetical protein